MADKKEIPYGLYQADEFLSMLGIEVPQVLEQGGKPIDYVVVGSCAQNPPANIAKNIRDLVHPLPGSTMLLIAGCCGGYTPEFQAKMNDAFPGVTHVVPPLRDHFGHVYATYVAEDLREVGLLHEACI